MPHEIANMERMKNEKKTLSTPLTRACEDVLKAHNGELQFPNEDGLVPQEIVIKWAVSILRVEVELAEKKDA